MIQLDVYVSGYTECLCKYTPDTLAGFSNAHSGFISTRCVLLSHNGDTETQKALTLLPQWPGSTGGVQFLSPT